MASDSVASKRPPASRAQAALALRLAGAPFRDIATTLGYSTAVDAQNAVDKLLAASVEDEDLVAQRRLVDARLSRMLQAAWPTAMERGPKQLDYMRMVLAIEERRARLQGTDAPTKHEVYSPTAEQIAQTVAALRAQVPEPIEAEIIDAEVVDDLSDAG